MSNYVDIIKTKDLKVSKMHHGLFLEYEYLAYCPNKKKNVKFMIEWSNLLNKPDCKIMSFEANHWFRTKKAVFTDFKGYKDIATLSRAVTLTIKNKGYEPLGWIKGHYE